MSEDDEDREDAGAVAGDVVRGLGEIAGVATSANRGDAATAIQSGLGAVGTATGIAGGALGQDDPEAAEALNTASTVAKTAGAAVGALNAVGRGISSGNVAGALGGAGGLADAARYIVPDSEVQEALGIAGEVARGAQAVASMFGQDVPGGGSRGRVRFTLEVADAEERWGVREVSLSENVNGISTCEVEARYDGYVEPHELLHKEVTLTLDCPTGTRRFRGIAWHARASAIAATDRLDVHLEVMPAAAYLGARVDSRIYQDKTVVEVIEAVHNDMLSGLNRSVEKSGLTREYERREYVVQYRESHLDFISRLAEEEGITWFFDHSGDRETLVLADTVSNLPRARDEHDGRVRYHSNPDHLPDDEVVYSMQHFQRVGPTDAVVADYDWSHPSLDVRGEQKGRSDKEPALEIFDHQDALIFHSFTGQYGGNTANRQAQMRAQRLDLDRHRWHLSSTVVTAQAGHTLEVEGLGQDDRNPRYLIERLTGHGSASEGERGTWTTTMEVVPTSVAYRPPHRSPRPIVPGPELATVVGPAGQEIHTDEHGRVRVHFPWDRHIGREAETSSCWIRVSQSWAGQGFGAFFLPRVGMEVVVSFLGGNPDRPLVTGCVYNGLNRAGVELPAKKTQTLIRTKSSPGDGFNEMRFEDEAGNEFIYVHAQKDYNEEVEHNHSTTVKSNQSLSVGHDQSETVGNDQSSTVNGDQILKVAGDRFREVQGNEVQTNKGGRTRTTNGNENVTVSKNQNIQIEMGNRSVTTIKGKQVFSSRQAFAVAQDDVHKLELNGKITLDTPANIELKAGGKTMIDASGGLILQCGAASISLTPASIVLSAPSITLMGAVPVTIMPMTITPTVINAGGGGGGGGGAGSAGDANADSGGDEGRSPEDQHALEMARLSQDAYNDEGAPEGWERVKTIVGEDGFVAVLYRSTDDPSRHVLAFRGTEVTDGGDWGTNAGQGLGAGSSQYDQSVAATDWAQQYAESNGGDLELTGHSLGGGMAALNGARTGLDTTTFNAAGVHPAEQMRHDAYGQPQDNITNYSTPGDPLTLGSEASGAAPDSLGRQRSVVPTDDNGEALSNFDPMSQHSIDGIVNGLEDGDSSSRNRFSMPGL